MYALLANIRRRLERLNAVVIHGAGQDIRKPKKDSGAFEYFLDWLYFSWLSFLDRIDSRIFFRSRTVRTSAGRVRSRGERKIVAFFQKHGIRFKYEPSLLLGKVKLHPDFLLLEYQVYVEFWGAAYDNPEYRAKMKLKKELYRKHGIPVISLYPRHLANLEKHFPNLLEKITGRTIPLEATKEVE